MSVSPTCQNLRPLSSNGGQSESSSERGPDNVILSWMRCKSQETSATSFKLLISPGHRANLVNCAYDSMGTAVDCSTGYIRITF
ncbi:hypothetical protein BSKO_10346 [Bryopsis sp. KO-2023]|nr:hypothetical protein BSKO_10346 [Bryopsis sp. KO-2023]